MKKIITGIAVLLLMVLAFTACQKNNETQMVNVKNNNKINSKDIQVINGRMVFKDTTIFYQHLRWILKNQNNSEIIEQFNENLGFVSMMKIYNTGINLENESDFIPYYHKYPNSFYPVVVDSSTFYELPASDGLAYLSNKDGVFQVGSDICRITFSHFIEIRIGDDSKISDLLLPVDKISSNEISISSTHGTLKYAQQYSYKTVYFSRKKRIVGRLYKELINGGIGSYEEYSARTTSQRKRFGIWWQRRISDVGIGWDAGYCSDLLGNIHKIPAYYDHKTNSADIKRIVYQATFTVDNSHSTCLARHYGNDGGNIRWITNDEVFH